MLVAEVFEQIYYNHPPYFLSNRADLNFILQYKSVLIYIFKSIRIGVQQKIDNTLIEQMRNVLI